VGAGRETSLAGATDVFAFVTRPAGAFACSFPRPFCRECFGDGSLPLFLSCGEAAAGPSEESTERLVVREVLLLLAVDVVATAALPLSADSLLDAARAGALPSSLLAEFSFRLLRTPGASETSGLVSATEDDRVRLIEEDSATAVSVEESPGGGDMDLVGRLESTEAEESR